MTARQSVQTHHKARLGLTWGVLTTTAPASRSEKSFCTYSNTPRCSSDVPGGVSIIKQSKIPQQTELSNSPTIPDLRGPLQITALLGSSRSKPTEMTGKRCDASSANTGVQPSAQAWTWKKKTYMKAKRTEPECQDNLFWTKNCCSINSSSEQVTSRVEAIKCQGLNGIAKSTNIFLG